MAFSSVILYLAARKSSLVKNSTEYTNLSMYLIPTIVFLATAFQQEVSLVVTPYQLLILTIFAICFSWLGNVASLKSIEMAPNPGYSLVISKSYVVMTTILSVLVFGSEISWQSAIAIVTIVGGMAILSVGKSTNQNVNSSWLPLAFLAFVCWGLISLTSKYLFTIKANANMIVTTTSPIEKRTFPFCIAVMDIAAVILLVSRMIVLINPMVVFNSCAARWNSC